jgi:hypothetical protein
MCSMTLMTEAGDGALHGFRPDGWGAVGSKASRASASLQYLASRSQSLLITRSEHNRDDENGIIALTVSLQRKVQGPIHPSPFPPARGKNNFLLSQRSRFANPPRGPRFKKDYFIEMLKCRIAIIYTDFVFSKLFRDSRDTK